VSTLSTNYHRNARSQVKLSDERQTAALAAFAAADAQHTGTLSQEGVRSALQTLGLRLDDVLFERFIGTRWATVVSGTGVNSEGFLMLYAFAVAPATKFGSALRKAAGRGDGKLIGLRAYVIVTCTACVCRLLCPVLLL
jgi:hypothetical protein